MTHPLPLVKKTLHRHPTGFTGFEPQCVLPFGKREKVLQILGEAARAITVISLFVLPFSLLVVLASSTENDQPFCVIARLC
jgi:hypothetical protein